jgi:hypothetical protein
MFFTLARFMPAGAEAISEAAGALRGSFAT